MRDDRQRHSEYISLIFLVVVGLGQLFTNGCVGSESSGEQADGKEKQIMIQLLEQQLDRGDGDARETARQLGASAGSILWRYFQSESEDRRALALECLAEVGTDEAIKVLVMGLEDPALDVRYTAVRLLHRVHSAAETEKLRELVVRAADKWVRGNAALILGRLQDAGAISIIKRQLTVESDPLATEQMNLALARLEDGEARQGVLKRLADEDHRVRYQAVNDFVYLNESALAAELLPLLSDMREVKNIGAEPYPVLHRVCDRAVDAAAALFPGRLPFDVGPRRYTDEEIEQVRALVQER